MTTAFELWMAESLDTMGGAAAEQNPRRRLSKKGTAEQDVEDAPAPRPSALRRPVSKAVLVAALKAPKEKEHEEEPPKKKGKAAGGRG